MTSAYEYPSMLGQTLYDADGEKIGRVEDLYTDDASGRPEWATVSTGWFGSHVSFVPVEGCTSTGDGFRVACTKHQVEQAPRTEPDGHLTEEDEARLYAHYGVQHATGASSGRLRRWAGSEPAASTLPVGREEQVVTNTEVEPAERVRLTTETVTEEQGKERIGLERDE